jgi:hypothetical protein
MDRYRIECDFNPDGSLSTAAIVDRKTAMELDGTFETMHGAEFILNALNKVAALEDDDAY